MRLVLWGKLVCLGLDGLVGLAWLVFGFGEVCLVDLVGLVGEG